MKLLDWNNPEKLQERGRFYAEQLDDIQVLIQPVKKEYSKNVWDNCAAVLEKKSDEELKPYLGELLEWLQDRNWPGAERIFYRLRTYRDQEALINEVHTCIQRAEKSDDRSWKETLNQLIAGE